MNKSISDLKVYISYLKDADKSSLKTFKRSSKSCCFPCGFSTCKNKKNSSLSKNNSLSIENNDLDSFNQTKKYDYSISHDSPVSIPNDEEKHNYQETDGAYYNSLDVKFISTLID